MTGPVLEVEIKICEGNVALNKRRCPLVRLRDGRSAVFWRGLAFPVLPGDRINIAEDAYPITETLPSATLPNAFAVIDGQDEAYILMAGGFIETEAVAGKLRQARIVVLRTGRYFGEPVPGIEADWFIRIVKPSDVEDLATALEPIIAAQALRPEDPSTTDLRTRLLTVELLAARAREAGLQVEIARLRSTIAQSQPEIDRQSEALQEALAEERRRRIEAEEAAAAVESRPKAMPSGRVADEVRDVLAGLLPHMRMLRDSVEVMTAEYASRQGVWRALGELTNAGGIPRDWKKIHGADGWLEQHLINGRDNTGRIYVPKSGGMNWDVLVSHKAQQPRDVAWLARQ
jgi:NTP pyrophosphatase (non-canonical NTP hydrolase)